MKTFLKITFITLLTLLTFRCSNKKKSEVDELVTPVSLEKTSIKKKLNLTNFIKTNGLFKEIESFPIIKDSTAFMAELCNTFNLKIEESPFQKGGQKITTYKKVKINGSDNEFYFIEYDWGAGCNATYPWKYQLLLTKEGKLVKLMDAYRFEFVKIFKKENPFLQTTFVTGHGNGGHRIYKVSADSLENVYEGYYNYNIRTYDADETFCVFKPYELNISFKDNNSDGCNDIIFTGQKLMLGKYTKDSIWYDVENGKPFTHDHPASIIPIKYIFIYDKKTGHFKAKEKYKSYE
jgi:hypothetical protein